MIALYTILDGIITQALEKTLAEAFVTTEGIVASEENKKYRNPPKFKVSLTKNTESNIVFSKSKLFYKKRVANAQNDSERGAAKFDLVEVPEEIAKILLMNLDQDLEAKNQFYKK